MCSSDLAEQVPATEAGRRAWLNDGYRARLRPQTDRYRQELLARYGETRGRQVEFAEVFEISEYAAPLDTRSRERLFPE